MQQLLAVLIILSISACAQSPESSTEIAVQGLFDATMSSDGRFALIASHQHGASYWKTQPVERQYSWNHSAENFTQVTHVALSSDDQKAATAHKNQWVIWDTETGKSLGFWQTPSNIASIALNIDGSRALIGQTNGDVWYTNTISGDNEREFKHQASVSTLAISDKGNIALTGSDDFSAKFWNLESGKLLHTITLQNMCRHVTFSDSGKIAFVSSLRNEHLLLDTNSFKTMAQINERYTNYNGAQIDEDQQQIYLANQQGYIQAFDINNGSEIARYHAKRKNWFGGQRSVEALQINSSALLAITSDGQLQKFTIEK